MLIIQVQQFGAGMARTLILGGTVVINMMLQLIFQEHHIRLVDTLG